MRLECFCFLASRRIEKKNKQIWGPDTGKAVKLLMALACIGASTKRASVPILMQYEALCLHARERRGNERASEQARKAHAPNPLYAASLLRLER